MADNDLERGIGIFTEVYGEQAGAGVRGYMASGAFGADQARLAMEMAFGMVWAREGLERKLRSAAVLGMLIGRGQVDEIRYHTRMGLHNGLTRAELEEIMITAVPYCGLPASNVAKAAMLDVFAEIDGKG
jgi:4-carboxymuconolactone decarboxylase